MGESFDAGQAFIQRVAPALPHGSQEALRRAAGSLWSRRRTLTLVSIASPDLAALPAHMLRRLESEVDSLTERHGGMRDRFAARGVVVFFSDASDAVRMALQLQRTATALRLRIGVDTAECLVVAAEVGREMLVTLVGPGAERAAGAAANATNGSIFVCPAAYALSRYAIETDTHDCLLAEEFENSQLAQVTITPAPARGSAHASTFAGLGTL